MRCWAVLLGLGVAGLVGWAGPAHASGDVGCRPSWTLGLTARSDCDSRLVLGPANDTRVNLILLMRARRGAPVEPANAPGPRPGPAFSWTDYRAWWTPPEGERAAYLDGEGSRCRSNDGGRQDFAAAVTAAADLAPADRAALIAARQAFDPDCETAKPMVVPTVGAAARPWADYLTAAAAFYNGGWDEAARGFTALAGASDPWLAETARYMGGRVALNQAQRAAFDEWGEPDLTKIDRPALARAQAGFESYLARHPRGRYAVSARGLLRRVWWLGGDTARLAAAYGALMVQDPVTRGIDDLALAEEIDNKLGATAAGGGADPVLLAVADLRAMRTDEPQLTAATLAGQQAAFARDPALYAYLRAAFAFYVARRPADVLALLPDQTRERAMGPVTLARQVLRGQALDAVHDASAGGFWLALLPGAPGPLTRSSVELGLALHEERAAHLDAVLAPGSALTTPVFRETLLFTVADAAILRRAVRSADVPRHERDVALFILLYKELSRDAYAAFVQDLQLVPAAAPVEAELWDGLIAADHVPLGLFTQTTHLGDLGCPPLRATAATLAADPRNPRARLCVADFFQANGFDGGVYDAQPSSGELGGTRSRFPGRPYQRAAVYRDLLASPATPADDKAYALYRSIRCYAPVGNNSCGGEDVPVTTRRAWFRRLQTEYPRSRWAQSQLYW